MHTIVLMCLHFIGAPLITLEPGLITQRVSSIASKVYLDCPFIGNPRPAVEWYYGERLIKEDSKYQIHENGTLEISDYDVLDTATYRCDVKNEHGKDARNYGFQLWGKWDTHLAIELFLVDKQ